jgi:hypothetical protein
MDIVLEDATDHDIVDEQIPLSESHSSLV